MKTELRAAKHTLIPNTTILEIWYNNEFVGEVTGADGPGIRVISKNELFVGKVNVNSKPEIVEVYINLSKKQ